MGIPEQGLIIIFFLKVTWENNYVHCAMLGMEPLNFKNAAEMDCVANLTKRSFIFFFVPKKLTNFISI